MTSPGAQLPLSAAQREIWLGQQLAPDSPGYLVGEYVEIHGPVDPEALEAAVRQVVDEAEPLRARYAETDGVPRQTVEPRTGWDFPVVDVGHAADPRAAAEAWMRETLSRPMDLARDPLFRFALLRLAPDRFAWFQGYHHIVMDGAVYALVARRVAEVYTALVAGLPAPACSFGPLELLVRRDAEYRSSAAFAEDRRHWTGRYADRRAPAARLADRAPGPARAVIRHTAHLTQDRLEELRAAAARAGTRVSTLIVAATAAYLHRMTGESDVVLGMPVSARVEPDLRHVPGSLSNVLPLRMTVHAAMPVADLLRQAAEEIRHAVAHQRYRGEDLARDLELPESLRAFAGLQINILPFPYDFTFAGHRVTGHNLTHGLYDDLAITVYDRSDGAGLRVDFDANPDAYSPELLAAHQERFLRLLNAFTEAGADAGTGAGAHAGTGRPFLLADIDLLTAEEHERILAAPDSPDLPSAT
ncbi:condensation domain-containing protein, partial [Streptomyces sp. URMC 127]|uniref:condensation domain-containing protein n=1 Tax=Streptomyces sp. URMC 127 TaxID=3423402 RepID=UPI003F1A0139